MYRYVFPGIWLTWSAYWWLAAVNSKQAIRRESPQSRATHIAPLAIAVLLLALPSMHFAGLDIRFVPFGPTVFWLGAAITLAGLLFTVWARLHLGANWSATVTIKRDHELVSSGPYAYVRHPIYSGLLLAFVGSALGRGELRGLVAVLIAGLAFWHKLKIEERWLCQQFGEDYDAYRRRVAALIPFVL